MSIPISFSVNQSEQHSVHLEPTNTPNEKNISINGRNYKILGEDEDISLIKSHVSTLKNSDFESINSFKASLEGIGNTKKASTVFQNKLFLKLLECEPSEMENIINSFNGSAEEIYGIAAEFDKIDKPVIAASIRSVVCRKVIDDIAKHVIDNYFDVDVGKKCAAYINEKLPTYVGITDPKELIKAITSDLRKPSNDFHFSVEIKNEPGQIKPETERLSFLQKVNFGFVKLDTPKGGTAYLEIQGFEDPRESFNGEYPTLEKAKSVMQQIKDSNPQAIIIDLRRNAGGSPHMVQLISSYLLPPDVPLINIEYRKEPEYEKGEVQQTIRKVPGKEDQIIYKSEYRTLKNIPEEDKMIGTPLYILTSESSFSAAEQFPFNIQNLPGDLNKNCLVIGARTAGGANPCASFNAGGMFSVNVPMGEARNPHNGTNWEGKGVSPDYEVPKEEALDLAKELISKKIVK